jgi:hypothetical protein
MDKATLNAYEVWQGLKDRDYRQKVLINQTLFSVLVK